MSYSLLNLEIMADPKTFPQSNIDLHPGPGDEDSVRRMPAARVEITSEAGTPGRNAYVSCWEPSEEELLNILRTGEIWLTVYAERTPPVLVEGFSPFEDPPEFSHKEYNILLEHCRRAVLTFASDSYPYPNLVRMSPRTWEAIIMHPAIDPEKDPRIDETRESLPRTVWGLPVELVEDIPFGHFRPAFVIDENKADGSISEITRESPGHE